MSAGPTFAIRRERSGDEDAIFRLTADAFAPMSFSNGTEASIINALRQSGELSLSLVVESGEQIVGHVAFSPAQVSDARGAWYALGPISVRKDHQRCGIGRAMIEDGAARLAEAGAAGCVLTGNPDIYTRCGFRSDGMLHYPGTADKYVLWRGFFGVPGRGTITFASAFETAG